MSRLASRYDECFILVKALPHRSSSYYETVCCAGIGRDGKWRRQYPVPFRILAETQKFKRWQWIKYAYTTPRNDVRWESQKVVPESIALSGKVRAGERAWFLNPLIRESLEDAAQRNESLSLIRPSALTLSWARKSDARLGEERRKHAELARQDSFFDEPAKPLTPCPYQFRLRWADSRGASHDHVCDDWETSTAFFVRRHKEGEDGALLSLQRTYEEDYLRAGVVLAFSTHSRRNRQWLLVGVIRLDRSAQGDLLLA